MTGLLAGKAAFITGAGAGIGAASARRFAREGASLWLNDRRDESLNAVISSVDHEAVGGLVGDAGDSTFVDEWVVFFATRSVLPHMVAAGGGSIISMSSGAGIGGNVNLGGYAAAKAGVINLMETVATEHGQQGIRANAVTPGPTATAPLLAHLRSQPGGVDQHVADLDLARLTEPDEVAATVTWLASDESSSITGICLRSNIRSASRRPT